MPVVAAGLLGLANLLLDLEARHNRVHHIVLRAAADNLVLRPFRLEVVALARGAAVVAEVAEVAEVASLPAFLLGFAGQPYCF